MITHEIRGKSQSPTRRSLRLQQRNKRTSPNSSKQRSISRSITIVEELPARVYKRWIIVSIILTLVFSWVVFPFFFDTQVLPLKLGQLSEIVFESTILKMIPSGKFGIFGDEVLGNLTSILKPFWDSTMIWRAEPDSPGKILKAKGVKGKFPVVLIPGIISTGLELWEGLECAQPYFRQRLWGTLTMMRFMLMDGKCWMKHLRLNETTASDPENIRIRPAQGLEAADYVLPGFWVWARIIENLAEIGYDHDNLIMAPYDWRLDVLNLEKRDHYFSRLKAHIEFLREARGEKVVAITHSLGGIVWQYFMKWVESDVDDGEVKGGNGGPGWVAKHIEAIAGIGSPYLGVPKSYSTIISGEMRDTAQLGKMETFLLELLMSQKERLGMFRTWIGGLALLPKGGNAFWGSPTDEKFVDTNVSFGVVNFYEKDAKEAGLNETYYQDEMTSVMEYFMPETLMERIKKSYSTGGLASPSDVIKNDRVPSTWTNVLESRLPAAPNMRIYCLYGIGKDTERGYVYRQVPSTEWPTELNGLSDEELAKHTRSTESSDILLRFKLDLEAQDKSKRLYTGIYHVDGDGTVPVISNGYMCVHGWKHLKHLNPSSVPCVTREYQHEPSDSISELRGGPRTGDHVDILGNHEMTMDILKIVSGLGDEVQERIHSNVKEMSEKINIANR